MGDDLIYNELFDEVNAEESVDDVPETPCDPKLEMDEIAFNSDEILDEDEHYTDDDFTTEDIDFQNELYNESSEFFEEDFEEDLDD